jgi:signal transduction histidine kinase
MKLDEDYTLLLLSNFTHQVINPLNGVMGSLDNILDGHVPADRVTIRLRGIRGQLETTVSLIRNLAFFVQYTANYAAVKHDKMEKVCVLPQVIIEAASFYQEQGKLRGMAIELRNRTVQNAVRGNPDILRQVLMNIFDNCVKYGLNGSMIEVNDWIQKNSNDVIITISGESVGFTSEEDIFGLGVRGKEAKKVLASGTGLGLHVCKLIVENVFGGKISAQHVARTKITTFEIRLPGGFIQ